MSLPATRSGTRSGPRRITSTSALSKRAAVRSLAFKWIRIIFRCWKDGKPYDERVYQKSLRRRGSLLGDALALATGVEWRTVAGFKELSQKNA